MWTTESDKAQAEDVLVKEEWQWCVTGEKETYKQTERGQKGERSCESKEKRAFKMMHRSENHALPLAAVVSMLTSVLLQGTQAGVVMDFNHAERCKDSLYMGTPPRGYLSNSFKKICQRYEDKPRYVTLYDPQKHIPIYSAYIFKKSDGEKTVDFPWMFEPQVSVLKT